MKWMAWLLVLAMRSADADFKVAWLGEDKYLHKWQSPTSLDSISGRSCFGCDSQFQSIPLSWATEYSYSWAYSSSTWAPEPVIVGGPFLNRREPDSLPVASIERTTLYELTSPSGTRPKTTWLPSSHRVTTVVMKNCEPLLQGVRPCVFCERRPANRPAKRRTNRGRRWPWRA